MVLIEPEDKLGAISAIQKIIEINRAGIVFSEEIKDAIETIDLNAADITDESVNIELIYQHLELFEAITKDIKTNLKILWELNEEVRNQIFEAEAWL